MQTRTSAFTPLTREGEAIGMMAVNRSDVRPFSEKELELMRGFADQAVIAIENARLLTELRESLDRQTATADILRVIASTPGDPKRALDTIAETAVRMFGASSVGLRRIEGRMLRSIASAGPRASKLRELFPECRSSATIDLQRCALENRQIHIEDDESNSRRAAKRRYRPHARIARPNRGLHAAFARRRGDWRDGSAPRRVPPVPAE